MFPIINQRILNRLIIDISINRPSPTAHYCTFDIGVAMPVLNTFVELLIQQSTHHNFIYIVVRGRELEDGIMMFDIRQSS